MTINISSFNPGPSLTSARPEPVSVKVLSTQKATSAPSDSVKLSQAAQVLLLKQQGQGLSEIATNLSIPLATVDGYLGIILTKVVVAPAPVVA